MTFSLNEFQTHNTYVFHYDQIMMLCDTISARTFTLWYNDLLPADSPGKMPDKSLLTIYELVDE
jgi:hypothetical protein